MEIDERTTSIEDVKRLLLSGRHFTKNDLRRENYVNSSCLSQRIYDLRHLAKYGCLDWDIKWRSVPGKGTLREFWLEPEEIERIKNSPRMVSNNEQNHKDEQLTEPIENIVEKASMSLKNEDIAYEQTSLLLGGENFKKRW